MKNLVIASAFAALFASPAVFAQAKNFEGFNLQLSTGYQHNKIGFSDKTFTINGSQVPGVSVNAQDTKKGRMPLNLGLGYTYAVNDKFTLGGLVEWNPLKMKAGSGRGDISLNGVPFGDFDYEGKLENQFSISIVPGYAFSDQTLGYVKLGWTSVKASLNEKDGNLRLSKRANGVLIGAGAKHLFTKNVYGFAEANYHYYGSVKTSYSEDNARLSAKLKPSSYSILVGVGAQF